MKSYSCNIDFFMSVTSKQKQRNSTFDVIKCTAAFLVICIHYAPRFNVFDAYFNAMCRIAVPLFYIISGYYFETILFSKKHNSYLKKIITLTSTATVLYLAFCSILHCIDGDLIVWVTNCFSKKNLCKWILLNECPIVCHLWYLYALIYTIILNILLSKLKISKYLPYIALSLLLLHCILNFKYSGIYLRNWLFLASPFFILGRHLYQNSEKIVSLKASKIIIVLSLIVSVILLYFEMTILPYRDFYFFIIPIVLLISVAAIRHPFICLNSLGTHIGRFNSTNIYRYHILVGRLICRFIDVQHIFVQYNLPIIIFLVTLLFSVVFRVLKYNFV